MRARASPRDAAPLLAGLAGLTAVAWSAASAAGTAAEALLLAASAGAALRRPAQGRATPPGGAFRPGRGGD